MKPSSCVLPSCFGPTWFPMNFGPRSETAALPAPDATWSVRPAPVLVSRIGGIPKKRSGAACGIPASLTGSCARRAVTIPLARRRSAPGVASITNWPPIRSGGGDQLFSLWPVRRRMPDRDRHLCRGAGNGGAVRWWGIGDRPSSPTRVAVGSAPGEQAASPECHVSHMSRRSFHHWPGYCCPAFFMPSPRDCQLESLLWRDRKNLKLTISNWYVLFKKIV